MPKSKRQKAVALTKVKAKGRGHKEGLLEQIRDASDQYDHCFTFDYENFRTTHLTQVRQDLAEDSRIFMGNNKVMAIGLGRDKEESHEGRHG
eukprot:gene2020-24824_t